jgi:signal transduction histidine kinase
MMKRPKILIVDDREVNRYIRAGALQDAGYEILQSDRGRHALDLALKEKPDLVLLDIHLPDLSGHDVCRMIKSDPKVADIMVLQISASAVELADEVSGLEGGADGFLIEPVEPELLRAKVRSLLRLRAAEERLRLSNARLKEFAHVASHDLREPLRTVTLFAELLDREYGNSFDARAREYIKHILQGGQRMSQLVSDLLEYAQVTAEMDDQVERVSLESLVGGLVALNESRIQSLEADITWDPLPEVAGSRVRLTQLFQNLLDNSLKYARPEEPPRISIRVERQQTGWLFAVEDNGQGFRPEMADEIFGVFKRLHSKAIPGSGLGLAICKTVVEQHGGHMWAEGRPGAGATFLFTWPIAVPEGSGTHTLVNAPPAAG